MWADGAGVTHGWRYDRVNCAGAGDAGQLGKENAFCNHGGDDDGDGGDDGDGNGGDDDDGDGYGGDVGDGGDDDDGDAILVSGVVAKMRLRRHIALFDCVNMNCTAFSLCECKM